MIEDKVAESKFFLNKIIEECKKEKHDLVTISYYYSAFLSASYSVFDYVLHYANRVFGLGLSDEDYWDWRTFAEEAKKQGNEAALDFIGWWKSRQELENNMTVGKAFSQCRRINTHKRPTYKIGVDPKVITSEPKIENGKITATIEVKPNVHLQVEGFDQMRIDDACASYYSTIEKFAGDSKETVEKIREKFSIKKLDDEESC